MECPRCHGFMMKERLYDLLENDGQVYVSGWRWASYCTACGKISDWVVKQNQPADGTQNGNRGRADKDAEAEAA